jgi:hypothetical protein
MIHRLSISKGSFIFFMKHQHIVNISHEMPCLRCWMNLKSAKKSIFSLKSPSKLSLTLSSQEQL